MKKLLNLTTFALFMALSFIAYAENDCPVKQGVDGAKEDLVFSFMRKKMFIEFISDIAGKEVRTRDDKSSLPFDDFFIKLQEKSAQLVKADQPCIRSDSGNYLEYLSALAKLEDSTKFDIKNINELFTNEMVIELFKDCPATLEHNHLMFTYFYDKTEFFSGLLGTELSLKQMQNREFNLTKLELKELVNTIYNDEIEQYKNFLEENKDLLEKASAFADNGFKIKTMIKRCRTINGEKVYTSSNEEIDIKSLAEIMPYISDLEANPVN